MKLEIKKSKHGWMYIVNGYESFSRNSAKEAAEAGYIELLKLLPEKHDFGRGPVPAHRHKNGGGWVADTAHVSLTAFVAPGACVYGNAKIYDYVRICDNARVFGQAHLFNNVIIKDQAKIYGTAIIEGTVRVSNDVNFNSIKISGDMEITRA